MGIKDFFYLAYYHIDYFVADVFILYILSLWLWTGVFQISTFSNIGDIHRWTIGTIAFLVWIIPFILYLYYPLYAIKRKQKEIYISRMHHPVLIFMALLELYFLFFFHGGGLFHKDVMLFAGSLPNSVSDPLFESFGDLGVLMAILYLLGLLIIWIGSIEGYFPYYVEPLSKDTKKIRSIKATSKQSNYL